MIAGQVSALDGKHPGKNVKCLVHLSTSLVIIYGLILCQEVWGSGSKGKKMVAGPGFKRRPTTASEN